MSSETTIRVGFYKKQCYEDWCMQMKGYLNSLDLWKFVNGDYPCPVADPSGDANSFENVKRWNSSDEKAKKFMMVTINEPGCKQMKDCKTSHEMWLKLKEIFESKGLDMKTVFINELLSLKMNDDDDARIHIYHFCDIVKKLTKMEVTMNEQFLCNLLLQSLPYSFQNFRRKIESMDKLPSFEYLARKIVEEGIRKKDPRAIESVLAFNYSATPSALEEKHFWPVGDFSFNMSKKMEAHTCWYLDTKIPYHCCGEALLPRITPAEFAESVLMAGPDWILDPGTLTISSQYPERSLTIHDILCIRGCRLNVLSVNRIADMGYKVNFEPTHACIVDKKGRNILIAYRIVDIYWIVEDMFKDQTFPYYDANPAGETSGIFNCLTKWLGMSWC